MSGSTVISLIVALCVLAASVGVFVWVCRRVRRGGGGATVGMLGATHEMLPSDQRRATETILKKNAGDREEEDTSSDPPRSA